MQVCTSLQTDNHASTPPLSFLQAGCPSCRPTNSVKALKAETVCFFNCYTIKTKNTFNQNYILNQINQFMLLYKDMNIEHKSDT